MMDNFIIYGKKPTEMASEWGERMLLDLIIMIILAAIVKLLSNFAKWVYAIWCNRKRPFMYPALLEEGLDVPERAHGCVNWQSLSAPRSIHIPKKPGRQLEKDDLHRIAANENRGPPQEDRNKYGSKGYMNVMPGLIFYKKYKIIRKLGYDENFTVWLAKDRTNRKYVALKISRCSVEANAIAKEEIELLVVVKQQDPDHIGRVNVIQILGGLSCTGMYGSHIFIVLEPMGPTLLDLMKMSEGKGIQVSMVRNIMKQILRGVSYLHDRCRIIHTDLKPDNILIKVDDAAILDMADTARRFRHFGVPMPKTYVGSNNWNMVDYNDIKMLDNPRPSSCFENRSVSGDFNLVRKRFSNKTPKLLGQLWVNPNIQVKITDMSNACRADCKYKKSLIQGVPYRAIEVILDAGWHFPADIWSVACIGYKIATGKLLFPIPLLDNVYSELYHLKLIWERLGHIPVSIIKRGKRSSKFFLENGRLKFFIRQDFKCRNVQKVLINLFKWKTEDAILFSDFINKLIEPEPNLRITASKALELPWFILKEPYQLICKKKKCSNFCNCNNYIYKNCINVY